MRSEDLASFDLARYVRPGDGIIFGQGTGEPLGLTERLVAQRAAFSGATVFVGACFSRTFQPEQADHLNFRGYGAIGSLRRLAAAGTLDTIPCHISSVVDLIDSGAIRSDIVLLQVSPPNEHGEHSFGLVNDYLRSAVRRARVVIAEINEQVPWTPCDEPLRADEITVAVAGRYPPLELPTARFGAVERQLAAHLTDVIPEHATLQVGIGAVPEAILASLIGRRGLGIHSGMIGDSVVELVEAGAVDNAHKGIDVGVTVSGVLFGTPKLYRWAHHNPALRLAHTRYTHGAAALAQVQRLVSINSALEVDLSGQVNAEAVGGEHIGAVGGQVDFVRAAARSPGGVSIIALTATGKHGDSKIVARLSGPVTTARSDVDVVATEYGFARLRGLGLRERAKALIAIAAPQHREALERSPHEAKAAVA